MEFMANPSGIGVFVFVLYGFYFIISCLSVYGLILLILIAHKGLKALDIYINKNKN